MPELVRPRDLTFGDERKNRKEDTGAGVIELRENRKRERDRVQIRQKAGEEDEGVRPKVEEHRRFIGS